MFVQSGMFPDARSVATAASKLIVGKGLGLTEYDSMAGLHIIKGKVVLAANTMAAAIKASGKYDYRAKTTESECSITFYEVNGSKREEIGTTTFTIQDANNAGLRGDNWRKWPKAMLFAMAISAGYREHCPDALGSAPVYVHEHGESEIPEEPKATVAPREKRLRSKLRRPPELEDEMNPKEKLVTLVQHWCGCEPKEECYKKCKQILDIRGVSSSGDATEDEILGVIGWIEDNLANGTSPGRSCAWRENGS